MECFLVLRKANIKNKNVRLLDKPRKLANRQIFGCRKDRLLNFFKFLSIDPEDKINRDHSKYHLKMSKNVRYMSDELKRFYITKYGVFSKKFVVKHLILSVLNKKKK